MTSSLQCFFLLATPVINSQGRRSALNTAPARRSARCCAATAEVPPRAEIIEDATIKVRAERMVAGGDSMTRLDDGRVAFITGALPGELVDASIRNNRKDFMKVTTQQVIEPSPQRLVPECQHRLEGCGGCGWAHFDADGQFEAKIGIVKESLRRIGRFDEGQVESLVKKGAKLETNGYRTTIRLVGIEGGGVGFREERSDEVVPIKHCNVAHENLSRVLPDIKMDPGIRLTLRTSVATGEITARWAPPEKRRGEKPQHRFNIKAVNASKTPVVSGLGPDVHFGDKAFLEETIAGTKLRVSAPSFFQSGAASAELLVEAVQRAAPELATADHAVDAYGGVGLFAATIMREAKHITLIETATSSVLDAQENLSAQREDRSFDILEMNIAKWEPDTAVDVIVADPSRTGLGKAGVTAIVGAEAPVVVLVSCDPVSLARDAKWLAREDYIMESVEVLDLFPQTPHVECVTRFVKQGS